MAGLEDVMNKLGKLEANINNLNSWLQKEVESNKDAQTGINNLLHGKDIDKPGLIGRVRDLEQGQKKQTKALALITFFLIGGIEAIKGYVKIKFPGFFGG